MKSASDTLSQADAFLKSMTALREELAAALSKATPPIAKVEAALDALNDLRARADALVVSVPALEERLRGALHAMILANDDDAVTKIEVGLKSIAANSARISILKDEIEGRAASLRKSASDDGVRRNFLANLKDFEAAVARLSGVEEAERQFRLLLEAGRDAEEIRGTLWRSQQKHPDVALPEFEPHFAALQRPKDLLERLAKDFAELESPNSRNIGYIPAIPLPHGSL